MGLGPLVIAGFRELDTCAKVLEMPTAGDESETTQSARFELRNNLMDALQSINVETTRVNDETEPISDSLTMSHLMAWPR